MSGPFEAMALALAEVDAAARADTGARLRSLAPDSEGVIPDLVRSTLSALVELLRWIDRAAEGLGPHLVALDAVVAGLELVRDSFGGAASSIALDRHPTASELDGEALAGVAEALSLAGRALDHGLAVTTAIPGPESLAAIRQRVAALLGEGGSLITLMHDVGAEAGT